MRLSVSGGVLDTLRVMPYVPDLDAMLAPGYRIERDGVTYRVEPYELGLVVLPSGKVVGCDPLVAHATPFVDAVAPGRYPLRAWVAVLQADGGEWQRRITALQLTVLDEPIAAWNMALLPGQDVASLGDEDFFGYAVDAGTGTLADQVAIEALREWDFERVDEVFIPAQVPDNPIDAVVAAVVEERTGGQRVRRRLGMGRRRVRNLRRPHRRRAPRQLRHRFPRRAARIASTASPQSHELTDAGHPKIGRTLMPLSGRAGSQHSRHSP